MEIHSRGHLAWQRVIITGSLKTNNQYPGSPFANSFWPYCSKENISISLHTAAPEACMYLKSRSSERWMKKGPKIAELV